MAKKKVASKGTKKRTVNKSQAIRDYRAKNPNAGPTEVAKALAASGIKVSPALVSNVTAAATRKTGKKTAKRGRKPVADSVSLSALVEAANFADKVGGADKAHELLKAVEKLQK